MMETQSVAGVACTDLHQAMSRIDGAALARLEQAIAEANTVFVFGAGRSLLMLKAFAMRLMHIGLKVHVVGDVVTPALKNGDLLLLASASGETASLVNVATKAKQLGGTVALLTIFPESTLGNLAEVVVRIPAYTDKLPDGLDNVKGILPGGSLFEEAVMVLGDAMIVNLAQSDGISLNQRFCATRQPRIVIRHKETNMKLQLAPGRVNPA
ncbi:putative 3-hexulose-6-phosphate isomerase (PHI) from bacteriophage origin [Escherichia coli]|uniref:Putative 3-hexulose-6-phosphate isomerase (PHI) from bacteriophage origin n=1 Tax=Escherichia coli TaxID=562 RepID=A0A447X2F0_ECOLX|nr:putative 3-hexulose-6-phosphate isomerase (PHI) from bacteriophage origin [Escherichia coli]